MRDASLAIERTGAIGPNGEGDGRWQRLLRREETAIQWGAAAFKTRAGGYDVIELFLTESRLIWPRGGGDWTGRFVWGRWTVQPWWRREILREKVHSVTCVDGGMAFSGLRWGVLVGVNDSIKDFRFYGRVAESRAAAEKWQEAISRWAQL
jgi:hypothetical protein